MSQTAENHALLFTKTPGPSLFTVETQLPSGRIVHVTVSRKQVKNLNLRVKHDGEVLMTIPLKTSESTARLFIDQKSPWLDALLNEKLPPEAYDGASNPNAMPTDIPLWGELAPVAQISTLGVPTEGTTKTAGPSDLEGFNARLDAFYRAEVKRMLPTVVPAMEAAVGTHASSWQVRTMSTRWGSCTFKTAAMRINGNLAAYPPICLECTVAHELTHLLERGHNARFHALLETAYPRAREAEELLKLPARTVALRNERT